MKLRRSEIELISRHIVERLLAEEMVRPRPGKDLQSIISRIITEDLLVEDRLNEEVRNILAEHADEVQRHGVEYHRMFNLIKAKLIKERNLIL